MKKTSKLQELKQRFLSVDQFSEDVGFTIDRGTRKSYSMVGALLTLVIYAMVITYGFKKLRDLNDHVETNF